MPDREGAEIPNLAAAEAEAVELLSELLHRSPARVLSTGHFEIIVKDEQDLILFTIQTIKTDSPAKSQAAARPSAS